MKNRKAQERRGKNLRTGDWRLPPSTLKQRWRTALHEAGHVAAERVLKNNPLVGAFVMGRHAAADVGRDGCNAFFDAVVLAAGRAAGELADRVEPPPLPKGRPQLAPEMADPSRRAKLRREYRRGLGLSDDVLLARWAIGGKESEENRWAGRVYWVRQAADRFVAKNAGFIIRIAKWLYLHGGIESSGVEESLRPPGHDATESAALLGETPDAIRLLVQAAEATARQLRAFDRKFNKAMAEVRAREDGRLAKARRRLADAERARARAEDQFEAAATRLLPRIQAATIAVDVARRAVGAAEANARALLAQSGVSTEGPAEPSQADTPKPSTI